MRDDYDYYRGLTVEGGEEEISAANALIIIARELRGLRRVAYTMTFDPNSDTVLDRIHTELNDSLKQWNTDEHNGVSIGDVLARIADAIEDGDSER